MSIFAAPQNSAPFPTSDHWADQIQSTATARKEEGEKGGKDLTMFAEEEPSFWDFLDVINPLQHIPIVNNIYRELTGDEIGVGARLAGGALFGGPIGLVASAVNVAVESETGEDMGGHVLAMFDSESEIPADGEAAPVMVAAEQPAAASDLPPAPAAAPQSPVAVSAITEEGPYEPPIPAASMPSGPLTMFNSAGSEVQQATESVKVASAAQAAASAQEPRFMPVPPRGSRSVQNAPPAVSVPISNSGTRSNVPITGRDPVASVAPAPATVQKILEEQAKATAAAENTLQPKAQSQDWFTSAMMSNLDKYEQAARMNRRNNTLTVQ